jgi:hypothetical protein
MLRKMALPERRRPAAVGAEAYAGVMDGVRLFARHAGCAGRVATQTDQSLPGIIGLWMRIGVGPQGREPIRSDASLSQLRSVRTNLPG